MTNAIKNFWESVDNWEAYKDLYKVYAKTPKPAHSKEYWSLLRNTLVTGVVVGVWASLDDAITDTSSWLVNALRSKTTLLETVILDALETTLGLKKKDWEELSVKHRLHLNPKDLKDAIEVSVQNGLIERPKLAQIQQILKKLGFAPGRKDKQLGYVYTGKNNND
ncbi:hypothetical protein [Microcoleus sp. CAWBG640]|uniref:hypothetical protein n=1 Tax=Microcoleus sp. CAWBG640 TaxID=2841653 RepID=UPI00312BAB16